MNIKTFTKYNDQETLKFISEDGAHFLPIFFLNNFNLFPHYKSIQNLTFEDLVIINTLGFYESEELGKYIFLRNNSKIKRVGIFKKFTEETCGLFVFREQLMNAIQYFTKWEFERVDKMRRDLGKLNMKCKEPFVACFNDKNMGDSIFNTLYENRTHSLQKSYIEKIVKQFFFLAYCYKHDANLFF